MSKHASKRMSMRMSTYKVEDEGSWSHAYREIRVEVGAALRTRMRTDELTNSQMHEHVAMPRHAASGAT